MNGYIHSIESCGTVDGPGIRFVVFVQGCPMRCLYCHNPDTWDFKKDNPMTADEILKQYDNCREFFKNGGITVTGGEPMAQIDFLTEGIQHLAIDRILADKVDIMALLCLSCPMTTCLCLFKIRH